MTYKRVIEIAGEWGISERSVRLYCSQGRVPGAVLQGKTWLIPADAIKPPRSNARKKPSLLEVLRREKASHLHGSIYREVLAYYQL